MLRTGSMGMRLIFTDYSCSVVFIRRVTTITGYLLAGLLRGLNDFVCRILHVAESHECHGTPYDFDGLPTPLCGPDRPGARGNCEHSGYHEDDTFKNGHRFPAVLRIESIGLLSVMVVGRGGRSAEFKSDV